MDPSTATCILPSASIHTKAHRTHIHNLLCGGIAARERRGGVDDSGNILKRESRMKDVRNVNDFGFIAIS